MVFSHCRIFVPSPPPGTRTPTPNTHSHPHSHTPTLTCSHTPTQTQTCTYIRTQIHMLSHTNSLTCIHKRSYIHTHHHALSFVRLASPFLREVLPEYLHSRGPTLHSHSPRTLLPDYRPLPARAVPTQPTLIRQQEAPGRPGPGFWSRVTVFIFAPPSAL